MTSLPETETLDLELKQGWLTIWFNQPDNRNALSDALVSELAAVLKGIREDRTVRGITLRGRGGIFCAGADLKNFKQNFQVSGNRSDIIKMSSGAAEIFDLVNTAPQVVIVLIEGACSDGRRFWSGLLRRCCDLRIFGALCDDRNRDWDFTCTNLSLCNPKAGICDRPDGREAHKLGFADFIAEDVAGLEVIEMQLRKQVLGSAPGAIAATKELLGQIVGKPRDEVIRLAAENFAGRMVSEEAKEGVASFFEKRRPTWAVKPE